MKVRLLAAAAAAAVLAAPAAPASATIRMCQDPADAGCFVDTGDDLMFCTVYVAGFCLTQVKDVGTILDIG